MRLLCWPGWPLPLSQAPLDVNGETTQYMYTQGTTFWVGVSPWFWPNDWKMFDRASQRVIISDLNDNWGPSYNYLCGLAHPKDGRTGWVTWEAASERYMPYDEYIEQIWGSNEVFGDGHAQFTPPEEMNWVDPWLTYFRTLAPEEE